MFAWLKNKILRLMKQEQSVERFTISFCVGVYIAFCPFAGFHTALVFSLSWLFGLNYMVVLTISMLINNPWTMIPVYGFGYFFGDWLLSFLGIPHLAWNPSWMMYGNKFLYRYVGISNISFLAYIVGGNVLGVAFGLLCYPLVKRLATRVSRRKKVVVQTVLQSRNALHAMATKATPALRHVVAKQKEFIRNKHASGDAEQESIS